MPGPLCAPLCVTSSTVVPPATSPTTSVWAKPVAPAAVAAALITLVPKPTGTAAENAPVASAVAVTDWAAALVSVSCDSMVSCAPGVVLPATVVLSPSMVPPPVGEASVTAAVPGAACAT